jgi:hypothetical protein
MKKHPLKRFAWLLLVFALTGCANGIVGKSTNANIKALDQDLNSSVGKIRDSVLLVVSKSRDGIFDYLKDGMESTSRNICIGILKGTIGWLDSADNRDHLVAFVDSLVGHTAGDARFQLIAFRDSLLSNNFIAHIRSLLRGVMQEVILNPSEELVNFALGDRTRRHIDSLLEMVIPAVLNDRALRQIEKLRHILLGPEMKKDIASLIDTSMLVVNDQLKGPLRETISSIVNDTGDTVKKDAYPIMYSLIAAAILIGLSVFFIQQYRINQKKKILYYLTSEIEKFRKVDEGKFHTLTANIRQTMLDNQLEGSLSKMLAEEGINTN